MYFKIRANNK